MYEKEHSDRIMPWGWIEENPVYCISGSQQSLKGQVFCQRHSLCIWCKGPPVIYQAMLEQKAKGQGCKDKHGSLRIVPVISSNDDLQFKTLISPSGLW